MCVFRHPNFIILPERNKIDHIQNPEIDMLKCNLFNASTKSKYGMHRDFKNECLKF